MSNYKKGSVQLEAAGTKGSSVQKGQKSCPRAFIQLIHALLFNRYWIFIRFKFYAIISILKKSVALLLCIISCSLCLFVNRVESWKKVVLFISLFERGNCTPWCLYSLYRYKSWNAKWNKTIDFHHGKMILKHFSSLFSSPLPNKPVHNFFSWFYPSETTASR